jgi:serine/threonine protein phosphatase PrpC
MQEIGFATTHVGRRANNEDAYCLAPHLGLYAVADGMGGHEGGEVASKLVIDSILHFIERADEVADHVGAALELSGAVRWASDRVSTQAVGDLEEMGTTLAALWIRDRRAIIAHVGDSRVYRLRDGHLQQLTRDHSMINDLEAQGSVTLAELLRDRISHVITRCISHGCNAEPDVQAVDLEPGDTFLVCSDGLSDVLSHGELELVLRDHTAAEAHDALVDRAYARGGMDNITAVVVTIPRLAD